MLILVAAILAQAAQPVEEPGRAVRRAMAGQGPIVRPADRATIRAKCGLAADADADHDINFTDGGLRCPDGRVVRDAETQAMSARISARARAHVRAAMSSPSVRAAIARYSDAKTREALARLER